MPNEFIVKNGLIVGGNVVTSGTITINGALAATQSWVASQGYLTSASLSGYATQSYVTSAIAALVDSAPAALDTLNELAAALGDDASFSTTITNSIANKVAKSGDTMTGSLLFANVADNVRLQKGSSFLNLRDPWNNIHLYNAGDGNYIDSNIHYWRSQSASYWMTLNNGNLGIGTVSPVSRLDVDGIISSRGIFIAQNSGTYNVIYNASNSVSMYLGGSGDPANYYDNTTHNFRSSGGGTTYAVITNGGNVGIGTTSPSDKLSVNGNIGVEYAGYFGFYRYPGAGHTFSTDGITSAMFGIAGGVFSGRSDAGLTVSGYDQLRFYTENAERIRINRAGKVSIGTTDTNSDKSDFTVYTGGTTTLSLAGDLLRVGDSDVNWGVALRSNGFLETYAQPLYLRTITGSQPVVIGPNGTNTVEFHPDYTLFNGLNLAISRTNSTHGASNYFRGDTSHLVIGTGGTLYLNYGGGTTIITGNTTVSGYVGVTGIVSANARKLSLGILDLNSGITPAQYKIKTNIPWNYGGSDFTVNIKGFRYGVGQMVSLSIGWHYYNNEFYNRNAISNGAWAPTISLAKSPDGYVIIYIPGPDYWPKLYVESVYSSNSADSYTSGWSWTDADLSDCTLIQTVPYKDLATNISGNAATATSATTAGALSSMNISQFTNNSGYITGYTETDTLASVTNRGNSTTDRINVRGVGNQGGGNIMMGNVGEGTSKWSYLTSTHYNASSQPQGFALIGGLATSGGNAVVIGGNIYETNPATEIQFWTHGTNTHNLGGTQRGVINSSGNWGIGTTSPGDYKLYVNGGQFGTLLKGGDLGTGSDVVRMIKSDGSAAMLVRGDGKVGIGTLSPSEELHVLGRGIFDGGSGNSSTDAVVYITKSNNNDWGLYVNAAALDYGMYTRVSPSAGYAIAVNNGTSWTTRITGDGRIYLNEKDTIASYDTWLRLNESGHYGSGVFTPGVMRADGGFQVSGNTVIHSGTIGSQSVSYANNAGYAAEAGQVINQSGQLLRFDNRIISPSETTAGYLQFGFTSWGNDNSSPYADYLHMRSYTDGSGGSDNLVMFLKSGIGMRIYQQTFGSATAYSSYADVWTSANFTSTNVSNWNTAYSWGNHASASYATTSYVTTQINNLINGAPGALDTLDELAAALGDDANFATTVTNSIAGKVSKAGDTMTGALNIDYSNAYLYIRSEVSGSGVQWHKQMWFGRYDNIQTPGQYPNYLPAGAYGYHVTQSSDALFVGLISRGAENNDYNAVIAWGDDAGDVLQFRFNNNVVATLSEGGSLTIAGSLTESSSIKLKENVETSEGNLEKVVNLRPVTYNKIGSQTTELGLIAEEVAEVYPEFVQYDENGEPIGVNYSRLTAALIGAVKELTNQVQELNKKING